MDPIKKKLSDLRTLILRESDEEEAPAAFMQAVPTELATAEVQTLVLSAAERQAWVETEKAVVSDLRFEYLGSKVQSLLLDFVCRVQLEPGGDHVVAFIDQNAKEPEERTCYFPVESLALSEKVVLQGVTLLPVSEGQIVAEKLEIAIDPEITAVAAVPVVGTDLKGMSERARARAEHALRLLRISFREARDIHDYQLRFRLGSHYTFGSGLGGWEVPPGVSWELEIDDALCDLARQQPMWNLPPNPTTKLQRRVDRALRWIEQAFLVGDDLLELLFTFFALEALLGDKSEKLKAHGLAFRRAMLANATTGQFAHPNRIALLYDKVRSAAVHGSDPPEIDRKLLRAFVWDTRRALVEFLEYADENNFNSRSKLLAALEKHPKRVALIKGLREKEPKVWGKFLDELDRA